jgi:anti-anti-sigma factor
MEIEKHAGTESLRVVVKGRLDGYWSGHLSQSLEESIQAGSHQVDLDLSQVEYLSSAGVRVLLQFYKKLKAIQGALHIPQASANVRLVLETSGMQDLLSGRAAVTPSQSSAQAGRVKKETARAFVEIETVASGSPLKLGRSGDPSKLAQGGYGPQDAHPLSFPATSFGLGLGALGRDFADVAGRFGEFISVGGATAYLPTDGSNVPDYMVATGDRVPEIQSLYGLKAEGVFSHFGRFDAKTDKPGTVGLTELLSVLPSVVGSMDLGFVVIAETAGLVGARLRRSPAGAGTDLFRFPEVRDWVMMTTERAHERTLCVLTGVLLAKPVDGWKAFVRPLSPETQGHVHAAVFPYRPLPRGSIGLQETIASLLEAEPMTDLLHLFSDPRETFGAGESEFWRGAFWAGPLQLEEAQ